MGLYRHGGRVRIKMLYKQYGAVLMKVLHRIFRGIKELSIRKLALSVDSGGNCPHSFPACYRMRPSSYYARFAVFYELVLPRTPYSIAVL